MRKKKGNGRGASGNNQLVAVIDAAAVDDFDFELMLEKTGTTYAKAYEKSQHEDDWF